MECVVKLIWDNESESWYTVTDDIPGLQLNALSFDVLVDKVRLAAPEILEGNLGYKGVVRLSFEAERVCTLDFENTAIA